MARVPVLGRLYWGEYMALLGAISVLLLEGVIRLLTMCMPDILIDWFYETSRCIFHHSHYALLAPRTPETEARADHVEAIRSAVNFERLCAIHGYVAEDHIVRTSDGYFLCLHRLCTKRGQRRARPGVRTGKPVVYLHHGLLMNSEVWVCLTDEQRSIPFVLVEMGYDVWFGNNRGNKYSKKNMTLSPNTNSFGTSRYDLGMTDIPETLEYILQLTKPTSGRLSYIGFSQGSAQAFAALSVHPQLNDKISVFIAIAPAFSPKGLASKLVDALMKSSPNFLFLFFGRKCILPSTVMWQSILYPPIFVQTIDTALVFLFSWYSRNISQEQKLAAYAHLYSFASVKSVVHWFQIMRTGVFQMYDDDAHSFYSKNFYHPVRVSCLSISRMIKPLIGDSVPQPQHHYTHRSPLRRFDSLVDIDAMLGQLPDHTIPKPVDVDVIPKVVEALEQYQSPEDGRKRASRWH
ncbi:putative triglyceride lipase-cholesterol esterase [Cantharellus anzutake]|uniref:putative triglyceride lipase-cholesterol esterase n=1 Tax=Cantharellus anzutake TaxID=1750568 RepID=UPI00190509B6|nr:putative triglyceride lipase-cholesterol esterase [Cantharellus anzutake]KAF8336937.1 putative triglyceride lipase-cholesterol esterase [Cantharellus anzutake]